MKDKELREQVENLKAVVNDLQKQYWSLFERFELLLNHLNLIIEKQPAHLKIKSTSQKGE